MYNKIDYCHQCGISETESQTFLLAKHCQRREVKRNGCFRRLIPPLPPLLISYTYISSNLKFQGKSCHIQIISWSMSANISRTNSFSKIQYVTTENISNEGSQTHLATCDLFAVAMMSFTSATPLLLGPLLNISPTLKICPNPVQDKSLLFSST